MPNHVKNIIKIKNRDGKTLEEIRATFINSDNKVDFNVIREMPECLKGFNPYSKIIGAAKQILGIDVSDNPMISALEHHNRNRDYLSYLGMGETPFSDDEKKAVHAALENHRICGYTYWYDWSIKNLGTKWNAYGQPEEGFSSDATEFQFETAWSHPMELITAMSEKLPGVVFSVKYADEDIGSNCGEYEIEGGKVIFSDIAGNWNEMSGADRRKWIAFAFSICNPGEDPRSYGYDENWDYSDEVYEAYEAENKESE